MGMMTFITATFGAPTPTLWDYRENRAFWVISSVFGDQWHSARAGDQTMSINLRDWDIKDWQQDVWGHLMLTYSRNTFSIYNIFWGEWLILRWMGLFFYFSVLNEFISSLDFAVHVPCKVTFHCAVPLYSTRHYFYYYLSIQLWHCHFSIVSFVSLFYFFLTHPFSVLTPPNLTHKIYPSSLTTFSSSLSTFCTFKIPHFWVSITISARLSLWMFWVGPLIQKNPKDNGNLF